MNLQRPFMFDMVRSVADRMQIGYPELQNNIDRVSAVVLREEEQFGRVLASGAARLEQTLSELLSNFNDEMASFYEIGGAEPNAPMLAGKEAFSLYETYGLPRDFIEDFCRDYKVGFDTESFEAAKEEEQQRARASWKGGSQKSASPAFRELPKTEFEGYTALRVDGARVLALVKDGLGVPALAAGEAGEAVLDATSFYADSGGQVGDVGQLYSAHHNTVVADVSGATKPVQGVFAHRIVARQTIAVGDVVDTVVDRENRLATERNHTGTHLLHAALREVLGPACEAGRLVERSDAPALRLLPLCADCGAGAARH